MASQNCGRFLCASSYSALDRLSEETDVVVKTLKRKGPAARKDLIQQLRKIEALNESYFKVADITFKKLPTSLIVKGQSVTYTRYQLRGSGQGDAISKSLTETSVPVILDPLYLYNYKYFGHYENETIFVGPHVFRLNLMGITSTLQHEQLHSVEHEKVRLGKMSLGRIELMNSEGRRSVNYGNYFRVDEIETHLNDYHLLTDPGIVAQRDLDLITQGLTSSALDSIKKYRDVVVKDKVQNLKRFSAESQEMLAKIKARIMHGAIPYSSKYDPSTGAIRVIFTTEYKSYEFMSFDLRGLIVPADLSDWVKVREIILNTINWSEERISAANLNNINL
ncbi:hypothetical protein [Bdellovibrio sp. KM01]|uniref:hypothetical protein n=1 Tax=Bdellovibrio sp. KM01 TaxID=2748865 RepID=UPI0015EA7FB8|nr:hypothetical protein [Bdellovibrio sp. KM01]QLY25833.1 hypothetical protein HW988_01955 [Bdellovibrio sp. KM01]